MSIKIFLLKLINEITKRKTFLIFCLRYLIFIVKFVSRVCDKKSRFTSPLDCAHMTRFEFY